MALGTHIYLWNASNGEIQQLLQLENPEDYVSSVKWIKEGNILAVGNAFGEVALWDVEQIKKVLNTHINCLWILKETLSNNPIVFLLRLEA